MTDTAKTGTVKTGIVVGIGCDRGVLLQTLEQALDEALQRCGCQRENIRLLASIDLKQDEVALLQLAQQCRWPLRFYPATELAQVAVPNPSETVRRYTGTPAVAEAAALLGAGTEQQNLLIEKHKLRGVDGKNATISIARCMNQRDVSCNAPSESIDFSSHSLPASPSS